MSVIPDYSPIYQGDTGTPFAPVFQQGDGAGGLKAFPLTGATLSARMTNQYGAPKVWNPLNWTIDDAVNGKAHYQYQAGDVDTVGIWTVQIAITIGGAVVHTDTFELEVKATV